MSTGDIGSPGLIGQIGQTYLPLGILDWTLTRLRRIMKSIQDFSYHNNRD
jgi:hypothetical protein